MKEYQLNWLKESGKSIEWLRSAFENGFDIHHLDGNHNNNNPNNLVLIYTRDHMMIHTGVKTLQRMTPCEWVDNKEYYEKKTDLGKKGYNLRKEKLKWGEIAERLNSDISSVYNATRMYAEYRDLPWFFFKKNKIKTNSEYLKKHGVYVK